MKLMRDGLIVAFLTIGQLFTTVDCDSQTFAPPSNFGSKPQKDEAKVVKGSPLQLVVSLTDGSRLLGTTTLAAIPLRSEALGTMTIPLDKVRSLKFSPKHESVIVGLANGDKLQGSLGTVSLKLQTLVGGVQIPLEQTLEIRMAASLASTLSEGLVAYFPFETDAEDHSGHGNTGKVVKAVFQSDETAGKKALQFNGSSSTYVLVPRSAALEPADGITISMWVKGQPGQAGGHGWGTVLRKADSCQPGYYIRGGGISSFDLHGANPCSGDVISNPFAIFDEQQWQHIVGTYSRDEGTAKAYQNGELVNQQTLTQTLLHSGDLYIGGAAVAGDDGGFRGLIAEVRIYNRGLSVAEVRALYNCGLNAR